MEKVQKPILVTGASGYIGGRLVRALLEEGWPVRAMARSPEKLTRRTANWPGVEVVQGDVLERDSLQKALRGVSVAYYLIHSMTGRKGDFSKRDIVAAQNFARACEKQGVERIIYLGGLGSKNASLSKHLLSRQQTGEALRSRSVPVTELRAAIIVGSGSASFRIMRDLVRKLPVMICPRWVQSRCEPIGIRQVLAYLTGCLREQRTVGETLEIGGGEVLTYEEMMRQTAREMGRKLRIIPVPVLTPKLSSYWLNLVTTVPMSIARPLVEGLKSDVVCHDHRIRQWIEVPQITFRQSVRRALQSEREEAEETSWTDASFGLFEKLPKPGRKVFVDERVVHSDAAAEDVFAVIQRIGGNSGWYYGDWLWKVRGAMDWLMGGIGMRRGRRHPVELAVGDPLDFWRVEEFRPGRYLALRAEMCLPGIARLDFEVHPSEHGEREGSFLVQRASFWPKGIGGWLYWYSVVPLHYLIFRGMARTIVEKAERGETTFPSPGTESPRET